MKKALPILIAALMLLASGCTSAIKKAQLQIQQFEGDELHISASTIYATATIDETGAVNNLDTGKREIEELEIEVKSNHGPYRLHIKGTNVKRNLIKEDDSGESE